MTFPSLARARQLAVLAVCACNSSAHETGSMALHSAGRPGGVVVLPPPKKQETSASQNTASGQGPSAGAQMRAGAGASGQSVGPAAESGGTQGAAAGGGTSAGTAAKPTGPAAGRSEVGAAAAGAGSVANTVDAAAAREDTCGPIPTGPKQAAKPKAVAMHALVEYQTRGDNDWTGMGGALLVPAEPPPSGVIFIWPGVQPLPGTSNVQAVGEGVLQPVLTWGSSCAPGSLSGHDTWWISPIYANQQTRIRELAGCHGGTVIRVGAGDRLDFDLRLNGTTWEQSVVDKSSKAFTEFKIDLRGQLQQRALFQIQLPTSAKPTEDVVFENLVLTMRRPDPDACALAQAGMEDYVSASRVSADGTRCCIERIVLRAEGVRATTTNP